MFGGWCVTVFGNMGCGVLKDELVLRVEPETAQRLLSEPHVRPMDCTGRPLKGFLYVGADALKGDDGASPVYFAFAGACDQPAAEAEKVNRKRSTKPAPKRRRG
jgi:hypothetical protein